LSANRVECHEDSETWCEKDMEDCLGIDQLWVTTREG
jgi:hypothetical protein